MTVMTAKQILLSQQLVWENLLIGCPDILRSLEEVSILKSSYLGRRTANFSVFQRSRPSKIKHFFLVITMSKQTDIRYYLTEYCRYNLNLVYHFLGLQYLRFIIPHPHLHTHPTSELYNCCDWGNVALNGSEENLF